MDNLDVTDAHYDKKISDLQRRLDAQYDKIDEVEGLITDLKFQIHELKKNQIDADSIYAFLGTFNELYAECTDARTITLEKLSTLETVVLMSRASNEQGTDRA